MRQYTDRISQLGTQENLNNRETVQVYRDDLNELLEKYDDENIQKERYISVIHQFVWDYNLDDKFKEWVYKKKEEALHDDIVNEVFGDIDEIIEEFDLIFEDNKNKLSQKKEQ